MDAIKELVNDVSFDLRAEGISLQAMDASHVALFTFFLRLSALMTSDAAGVLTWVFQSAVSEK